MNSQSMKPYDPWYWGLLGYAVFPAVAFYYGARMVVSTKYRQGLRQRLTFYTEEEKQKLSAGPYIWVHTVSLGELQAARPLLQRLKRDYPGCKTLVSTVTETGQAQARKISEVDTAIYLPLDLYPLCKRALAQVRPVSLIILETEIWPNLLRAAARMGIPLHLVNARLSDKSFQNYYRARALFAPLLRLFSSILAQSERDRERFLQLGAASERTANVGNIKFDSVSLRDDPNERRRWREMFHVESDEILILGGSTFPGEEATLARVVQRLRKAGHPVRLLIAPRHVDRLPSILDDLRGLGLNSQRRSQMPSTEPIGKEDTLLLDTTGELSRVYSAADLVFIGKSLHEKGGQNPIEPAAWGKAILFGPNMQNFRDVSALFLQAQAAETVADEESLYQACLRLCASPQEREERGQRAREVVRQNQGALDWILETIASTISQAKQADHDKIDLG